LAQVSRKSPPPQSKGIERASEDLEDYWKHPNPEQKTKKSYAGSENTAHSILGKEDT